MAKAGIQNKVQVVSEQNQLQKKIKLQAPIKKLTTRNQFNAPFGRNRTNFVLLSSQNFMIIISPSIPSV